MVNVSLVLQAEVFLADIKSLLIEKVRDGLKEAKVTEPGGVVDDFTLVTQSFKTPTIVYNGEAILSMKSASGEPVILLITQPIKLEAQKQEMTGMKELSISELTHALDKKTVDEHFLLATGTIEIEIMITAPRTPCPLKDLKIKAYVKGNAANMTPQTNLGEAIPIPGISDLIQKKFVDKLHSSEKDAQKKEIDIEALDEKLKTLPPQLNDAQVTQIKSITDKTASSFTITATIQLEDAPVPK